MGHCLIAYKAPFNIFVLGYYGVFILAISGYGIIRLSYDAGLPGFVGVLLAITGR